MIPRLATSLLSASRAITGETLAALGNPEWEEGRTRVLIVRLSPLRDIDRSSSHLILLSETRNAMPEAYIDFAFLPDRGDREVMAKVGGQVGRGLVEPRERTEWPWFFGAASGKSPADFDLILVSNAFGLELVNLPRLFSTSGIPLRASARRKAPGHMPIVLLGGSNAGQAAAIVENSGDSLVDGIFFGEGEGAIGPIVKILSERGRSREERLLSAASIEGFWPSLHPEIRVRRHILRVSPPPLLSWPPLDTPEATTARLQVTAGCPGYCSFCFEGWDRRPYRELPFDALLRAAREIRARNGVETLEVYSFNFNTHAEIFKLLFELGRIFKTVNLMSQRLDILASTPGLVGSELAAGKRSFTLGVEGISSRMRAYYRKGLDDAALDRLVELLVGAQAREIKLFYIIAGFEDETDVAEFAAFAARISERKKEAAPGLRILASAGYLVRLPGTPLGHAPLILDEGPYTAVAKGLEAACEAAGIEWRIAVHFDEFCADQLLSLAGNGLQGAGGLQGGNGLRGAGGLQGGGGLLPWLEGLAEAGPGLIYDGSLGKEVWPSLLDFARSRGILDAEFLGEKGLGATPLFPFLESGSEAKVLHREYLSAKAFIDRTSCLGGRCSDCGACPDGESRNLLVRHVTVPQETGGRERLERLAMAKRGFERVLVEVERPASLAGASVAAQEAWLLARLCSLGPEGPKAVFSAKLAAPLPEKEFGAAPGSTGWSLFEIEGPSAKALAAIAKSAGLEGRWIGDIPPELKVTLSLPEGLAALAAILARPEGAGASGVALTGASSVALTGASGVALAGASGVALTGASGVALTGASGDFARNLVAEWLAASRVASVERREGSAWRFDIAARDLSRRSVLSARVEGDCVEILIGQRARMAALGEGLGPRLAALLAGRIRLSKPATGQ